jgi:alkylhydroperoxidase family enzyme
MAFINVCSPDELPLEDRVPDSDNILQVHSVHPAIMRHHFELYVELMQRPGPLTRCQREMVAVVVSQINGCHY